jgi:hypothetical protein
VLQHGFFVLVSPPCFVLPARVDQWQEELSRPLPIRRHACPPSAPPAPALARHPPRERHRHRRPHAPGSGG